MADTRLQADELGADVLQIYASDNPIAVHGPYCHQTTRTRHGQLVCDYTCTRARGHYGPHVAHVPGGSAAAVWRNDDNPRD